MHSARGVKKRQFWFWCDVMWNYRTMVYHRIRARRYSKGNHNINIIIPLHNIGQRYKCGARSAENETRWGYNFINRYIRGWPLSFMLFLNAVLYILFRNGNIEFNENILSASQTHFLFGYGAALKYSIPEGWATILPQRTVQECYYIVIDCIEMSLLHSS